MAKLISEEIEELSTAHEDALIKYLDVIRANLKACAEVVERRLTLLFLSVFTFELLTHAAASEASLMGIKLTNLSLVEKLLPIAVGYAYYSLANIISYRRLLEEVHDEIIRRTEPDFFERNFERYGHPPTLFHVETILASRIGGRFGAWIDSLSAPLKVGIAIGPAIYLAYSISRCFWRFGFADPLTWLTSLVIIVFTALVFLLIGGVNKVTV